MAKDSWQPEARLPQDWIEKCGEIIHNEKLYENIIDPSPSVESQVDRRLQARRKLHTIFHVLFAVDGVLVDGLSQARRNCQDKWYRRAYAFERLKLEEKPISLIARELDCDESTIRRYVKDMDLILRAFDLLYVELQDRLGTRQQIQRVLHYISLGKQREEIKRILQRELKTNEVDFAYGVIRQTLVKVLREFFHGLRLNTEAVRIFRQYLQNQR